MRSCDWRAVTCLTRTSLRRGWLALGEEIKALAREARATLDFELIIQIAIFGGLMLALLIFPN